MPPESLPKIPDTDRSMLDRRLVSGVAWTALARVVTQVVTYGALLLQAKLLSPSDFGIVSMTYILLGFINMIAEFGIGSAILVMRELSDHQTRQMNAVSLLLGFAGTVASFLAARPTAAFFRTPELTTVVPMMGLGFLFTGFKVVPQALLARNHKFKAISANEAATTILQAIAVVLLAWLGMRYWSLVIGGLAAAALSSALFYVAAPCGFAVPVFRQVRDQVAYSHRIVVSRAAWWGYSNADFAIAGRILGESALGVYTMAWNLATAPLDRVVTLILRVTPSVFSSVQHDANELRRYLRVVTEGLSLLVLPLGVGGALVAHPAIAALFDKRWAGVVLPFQLLAIGAVMRALVSVCNQVQTTIRDVRYTQWQSLICLAVFPPCFWYASQWGGAGIAAVWVVLYPIFNLPPVLRTLRKIEMPKLEYVNSMRPAAIATAGMVVAVLAAKYAIHGMRPLLELMVESVLGACVYASILVVFFRSRVDAFRGLVLRRSSQTATKLRTDEVGE